ncbi:hypothetical protein C8J56DRAFT_50339 [Mycena floridula]|nr:hypothetical protein C8J56DRAFT_112915 [Mycena floridula]KAJ7588790.1 hypothetical protein C8J56DRAFT_50339 [Mycena floridula]
MLSAKFILAAFSTFVAVSAAPGAESLGLRSEQSDPGFTICSGSINPRQGCVDLPVATENCINLTGGLAFLNKQISATRFSVGLVCTFFEDFGCINGGADHHDVAVLTGGTWNFAQVQGIAGTQNFNDLTSSFSCSAV